MITINYLPHMRMHYSNLFFYYLNKIKDSNKKKIILNIYTSSARFFYENCKKLENIKYNIIESSPFYNAKLQYIKVNNKTEYSIKCDEDVFMNNFVLDFIIENTGIVDQKNTLLLSPLLSCNIPTTDYFINSYFDDNNIQKINNSFLKVDLNYVSEKWGYDYSPLNKFTIGAKSWNFEDFLEASNNINYYYKGIHPIRLGSNSNNILNNLLLENLDKFLTCKDFNIFYLKNRYFTNSFFLIRTDRWLELLNDNTLYVDPFDEVPLNRYAIEHDMNFAFINKAFAIHTAYNTSSSYGYELNFQSELEKKVINYASHL
jgi:hypothetical protein